MRQSAMAGRGIAVTPRPVAEARPLERVRPRVWPVLGLLLVAALPRLYLVFLAGDPQNAGVGWYNDTYHHWQIAYLSKEVGFSHGFLRLWDYKGLEYFWGILHPLLLAGLFTLIGSVDILIPRLVSVVAGSSAVVVTYLLVQRYFNSRAALGAGLLAALNPVGLWSDASGMQEPLGIALMLLGLYYWPRRPASTGLLWALAGMVRAEYWVFGLGLVAAAAIVEKDSNRTLPLSLGWSGLSLVYMKILLDRTGNLIYPVWWSFVGNAAGRWQEAIPLSSTQVQVRLLFGLIAALGVLSALLVLRRKPRFHLFFLFGVGNWIFLSLFIGFTDYLKSYIPRFWVDRIFLWPYMFLAVLIAATSLHYLPRLSTKFAKLQLGWLSIVVALALSQLAWRPIAYYSTQPEANGASSAELWEELRFTASAIADHYQGGSILIPEDQPVLTYQLVRFHGLRGSQLIGQMFDPFYYMEGDPFTDWSNHRELILGWLEEEDIQLLAVYLNRDRYLNLIEMEPQRFQFLMTLPEMNLSLYRVIQPQSSLITPSWHLADSQRRAVVHGPGGADARAV